MSTTTETSITTITTARREAVDAFLNQVRTLLNGKVPEANNTTDYDNGVKVVPSYLLDVVTVTKDNIKEALVDTGYWTQEQIDAGVA